MAKSKLKKMPHHLIRLGKSSLTVVLPSNIVKSLGWKQHQRVIVKKISGAVIIRDARTKHEHKK